VLRGYEQSLRARLLPALGGAKLGDIRRSDVQRLVNRMMADDVGASTVRNSLLPLRAIYRQALALDEVAVNPTAGVQLPAVRGKRERIVAPAEAGQLIAVLPPRDGAVWATAMYTGLRAGELQALTDELVDLDSDVIRIQWTWDPVAGRVAPKSRSGRARCPSPARSASTCSSTASRAAAAAASSSAGRTGARSPTTRSASGPRGPGELPVSSRSAFTSAATPSPR
jgi:integrase